MQIVFNKLFKNNKPKKVGLKKVELSSDFHKEMEYVQDALSLGSYYAYERFEELEEKISDFQYDISVEVDNQIVNSEVSYPSDKVQGLQNELDKIVNFANEMGISPSDLMPEYDEAIQLITDYENMYKDYKDAYLKVVDTAGFLATFM